jgi:beta-lactam-binding protein with PASTA domain
VTHVPRDFDWNSDPVEMLIERVLTWLFAPSSRAADVTVPNVTGLTVDQAATELVRYRLRMQLSGAARDGSGRESIVVDQRPSAGTEVRLRAKVRLRAAPPPGPSG